MRAGGNSRELAAGDAASDGGYAAPLAHGAAYACQFFVAEQPRRHRQQLVFLEAYVTLVERGEGFAQQRQGLAQRLMAAIEDEARAEGKTVLVLDTVTGGDAERLYARAGWQRVGVVPNYALMPDGAFCGTTFFCKQLGAAD